MEDKLKEELVLSRRNEDSLKRELEEVRESMTRMDSSTKKLDHMLGVGKSPCDKRVLEIGQSSNAQVKMGPRRQPQAQPPRVPQANILLKWLTKERGLSCNLKLGSNLDRFNNEDALNPFIHKDKDKV
ncbi:hypothetical protein LWI29_001679 [Acer saccharum]|uniref:Uncharacterized protein n=1 Tax=Acer saccharum TaxID=4024 RepID=A0AA39SNH1_ACESA|nr:hypothetical protein LWI29_001679 [Acer saccharum]